MKVEDQLIDCLNKSEICRLMESNQIHTGLLREPADVMGLFLSSSKTCGCQGNLWLPVRLTSSAGQFLEQILLKAISKHLKVIGNSQYGFTGANHA